MTRMMKFKRGLFYVWFVSSILWLATLIFFPGLLFSDGITPASWFYYGPPLAPLIVAHLISRLFAGFKY